MEEVLIGGESIYRSAARAAGAVYPFIAVALFLAGALGLRVVWDGMTGARELTPSLIAAHFVVWAGLMSWLVGEACWVAVRGLGLKRPTLAGRGRAALLGAGFGLASLLILPLPFVVHELWLAIPLTMIEGRSLPDALGRAHALAARRRGPLLADQARLFAVGLAPFLLAAALAFSSTFMHSGDYGGPALGMLLMSLLTCAVAALFDVAWLLCGASALYLRYGAYGEEGDAAMRSA
jgi:hypothetical protein